MHDAKAPQIKTLLIISHYRDVIVRAEVIYHVNDKMVKKTP